MIEPEFRAGQQRPNQFWNRFFGRTGLQKGGRLREFFAIRPALQ